jgi:hypothetical protein
MEEGLCTWSLTRTKISAALLLAVTLVGGSQGRPRALDQVWDS